jgi:DNA-binding CsgD family transcriptional regulator
MARQGCAFQEPQLQRIISLLVSTDMTLGEIALRMGCNRSAVANVHRRLQIRDYGGRRSSWVTRAEPQRGQQLAF